MAKNNQLNISSLPEIPEQAVKQYEKKLNLILNRVNDILSSRDDLNNLIGYNSLSIMYDLNENNAKFMSN
ncbi:MAG: hypothetical protein ACQEQP_06990, partial [Bacillota bacterium]